LANTPPSGRRLVPIDTAPRIGAACPHAEQAPAAPALAALGVDLERLRPGRRRLAFQCLDATERAPHLAGALGDRLAAALLERGWVERTPGGRAVRLTASGAAGLRRALGLDLGG